MPAAPATAAQTASWYVFPGKPDGLGWYETIPFNFVFVNHELSSDTTTFLTNDTSSSAPRLQGARVSLLRFDKNWDNPAGKNLITRVVDGDTTYLLDDSPAVAAYVDETNNANTLILSRFCSGYLAETGFVDALGAPAPVWFAPEEVGTGRGYAVFLDGTAQALPGLGRFAKEQVLAASQYRGANSSETVLLATEDFADGELYLFVGAQTEADPNGFNSGQLYVLRLTDGGGAYISREADMPVGTPVTGAWTPVDAGVDLDDAAALSAWVNDNERSTNFWRLEDIAEDPNQPGTFYFTTTGGGDGNPNGMLHRLTLGATPTSPATVTRLLSGSSSNSDPLGRRYDNVAVTLAGQVIIQEDGGGSEVLSYDIAGGGVMQIFDVLNGGWESSGVIETLPGEFLMSVQAHGGSVPGYGEDGALVWAEPAGRAGATGRAPTPSSYLTDLSGGGYNLFDLAAVGTPMTHMQPAPTSLSGAQPTTMESALAWDWLVAVSVLLLGLLTYALWARAKAEPAPPSAQTPTSSTPATGPDQPPPDRQPPDQSPR